VPNGTKFSGRPRGGFTLVEILTTIAIASVLTAITLPVFSKARETGRRASCLSNLHQISLAFAMYMADSASAFPNNGDPYLWMGRRWRWPLEAYLGETLERHTAHLPGTRLNSAGNGYPDPNLTIGGIGGKDTG
jgi:prepilin-type N-terminal cleavage/methylation domain-containing protein